MFILCFLVNFRDEVICTLFGVVSGANEGRGAFRMEKWNLVKSCKRFEGVLKKKK